MSERAARHDLSGRTLRVLIVEDVEDDALLLLRELRRREHAVQWQRVYSADGMRCALAAARWDLVISDFSMPGFGALPALALLRELELDLPFIIVSGVIGEESAVEALRGGAHDYVPKGAWARLNPAVERELAEAASRGAQRRSARALEESERRLRAVLAGVVDAILTLDAGGRIESANPAALSIFGRHSEELVGRPFPDLLCAPHDSEWLSYFERYERTGRIEQLEPLRELAAEHPDRGSFPLELAVNDMRLEGSPGLIVVARDITERKQAEEQLRFLADHDGLTGLLNRRTFEAHLTRMIATSTRYSVPGALVLLDIDGLKDVNDTLGHAHGDVLIRIVGAGLAERVRETDIVARLGGDEFAVLLPHTGPEAAQAVANDMIKAIRARAIVLAGQRVRVTASAGVAQLGGTREEVMVAADVALYAAKDAGRDRACNYTPQAAEVVARQARASWPQRIRRALDEKLFVAYRQPILDLDRKEVSQYELLVRMLDAAGEPVLPGAFLASAERTGLIGEIDRFMVGRAIALIASSSEPVSIEVNLSARSLADDTLPSVVEQKIAAAGIDAARLIFEITETAAIANMEQARSCARALREIGCGFALDDFGAGFASFYYLKHLPVDLLKIDRDFIRNLPRSHTDQLVVRHMIDIGRGLGLRTIAEGVEDEATLDLLIEYGADFAQGFHIGRPEPAEGAAPARAVRAGAQDA